MVMVEGQLFKYPKQTTNKTPKTNDTTNDFSAALGTWSISVETPGGTQQGSIQFFAAGRALSGLLKTENETSELKDIKVEGQTINCKGFAQNSEIAFTLKIEGDTLSGSVYVTSLQSDLPVTGSRTAKPN